MNICIAYIKHHIDKSILRGKANKKLELFVDLALRNLPPEWNVVPGDEGYGDAEANMANRKNLESYNSCLIAAESFLEAHETSISEYISTNNLYMFYEFKWKFLRLAHFIKKLADSSQVAEGDIQLVHSFYEGLKTVANKDEDSNRIINYGYLESD